MTGPELIAFINQDEAVRPDGKRGEGLFAYLRSLRSTNGDRRDVIAKVFQGTVNRMTNGYLRACNRESADTHPALAGNRCGP